jgi:hypothetical protein
MENSEKIETFSHTHINTILDYAYSPTGDINAAPQRIRLPKKPRYMYYGTRILKKLK